MSEVTTPEELQRRLAAYRARLQAFDWAFDYSDDARYVRAARTTLAELKQLQAEIDPDRSIWTQVVPGGM
jgi:hypothetical protein